MILEGSRYENAEVLVVQDPESGRFHRAVSERYPYGAEFSALTVITQEFDRIDLLADRYYEDPTMWWVIAYANPEIHVWDPIPVGVELRIPRVAPLR